jgi:hypothetical protein
MMPPVDVRGHVRGDLGEHDDYHGDDQDDGEVDAELGDEHHGVPDRLAEDYHRGRSHCDPNKAEGRHREREAQGLSEDLRALAFCVASEVRYVERERDPVTNVGRQRGPEERPEGGLPLLQLR